MCEHDITKQDTSVVVSKRRCMVAPSTLQGICLNCGKSLTYIKNQDEVYVVLKEGANEDI